jgi:hypothetical protein
VWGRTRWVDQGGTKRKLDVPDSNAWVTVPAPALRIIDEALWKASHERLAQGRAVYMARTNGQAWGRPLNATESKYLLTGLLQCKHCGGGLHVSRQSGRRGQGVWLPERITAAVRRAAARLTAKPDSGRGRRRAAVRHMNGRYSGTVTTFDGRRRYEFMLPDPGTRVEFTADPSAPRGPACSASCRRIRSRWAAAAKIEVRERSLRAALEQAGRIIQEGLAK